MMPVPVDYTAAVAAAIRAPSLHNSQPWRFRRRGHVLEVRLDPDRTLPAADPTGWAARLAGGAAVCNLRLALAVQGWQAALALRPNPRDPDLLAVVEAADPRPPTPVEQRLAAAIWRRRSHRGRFWPDPVPAAARARLVAAAREQGGWLDLLVGPGPADAVAQLAHAADQVLMRRPAYRAELASWVSSAGDRAAGEHGDGVPPEAAGPPPQRHDLLPARPYAALAVGEYPAAGGAPGTAAASGRDTGAYPLVAVLGTAGDTPGDQFLAGEVLQWVLLSATDAGLATAMVSQPIEVAAFREQVRLALGRAGSPQMLLRIGYGTPGPLTPRRHTGDVLEVTDAGEEPAPVTGPAERGPTSLTAHADRP